MSARMARAGYAGECNTERHKAAQSARRKQARR